MILTVICHQREEMTAQEITTIAERQKGHRTNFSGHMLGQGVIKLNLDLEPHIVEEYKIGETIIKVADNAYRNRTAEEIAQTLNNVKRILTEIYMTEMAERIEKSKY